MIEFNWSNVGKGVVSSSRMKLYKGFTPSGGVVNPDVEYIAPGNVAGKLTSYKVDRSSGVPVQYLQIDGSNYVELTEDVKFVGEGYAENASLFSEIAAGLTGAVENVTKEVSQAGKNLNEGFKATKERSFGELLDYAGTKFSLFSDVKKALYFGGGLMIVLIIIQTITGLKK